MKNGFPNYNVDEQIKRMIKNVNQQNKHWIHFVYILVFLCWTLYTLLNFPIWLIFPHKDFS